jgi:outer membrane receptor for ferrienterochelin and colicins
MHVTSIGGQQVFVLIGENLETEYSNAYTGSLNFTKGFGPIQTSLLVEGFYTDLQNPFTNIMTSQDENLIIQEMRNGTGAKVYGSNIELNVAPSAKYTFQMGGTIQRSEFNDDQLLYEGATPAENISSRRFVRTPNVYGYLNANWKPLEPFSVDVTGVYTGSMIVPHVLEGEEMILKTSPDFFEANFRLGYTFSLKKELSLEVFGGMQNVFNAFQKDFDRGALRDSNYIYGPSRPRTITFGIKIGHFH